MAVGSVVAMEYTAVHQSTFWFATAIRKRIQPADDNLKNCFWMKALNSVTLKSWSFGIKALT